MRPRATPGFAGTKDDGKAALERSDPASPTCRSACSPRAARRAAEHPAGPAGHGHVRQGRVAARRRPDGSPGPDDHLVQGADAARSSHGFLWRIRRRCPSPGYIGIFDRSHYEDVLIARVRDLVAPPVWTRRYGTINRVRGRARAVGMTVVKCFLHISPEEQKARLVARLDDPTSSGSTTPATSTPAQPGPRTEAYPDALSAATPPTRPGTSSRPTASGTATGRS